MILDLPFRLRPYLERDYRAAQERFREACKLSAGEPDNDERFREAAWELAEAERRLREVR